jgi:thymidylate kinase
LALAAAEPARYVVLDATLDPAEIAAQVRDAIGRLLS